MSFIINGTGKRVAVSANSTPAHAASLHIEYSSEVVSCTPEWNI